jgi:hypothetical protein
VSKRGEAPLKTTSPSPYQGEGDKGDGVLSITKGSEVYS